MKQLKRSSYGRHQFLKTHQARYAADKCLPHGTEPLHLPARTLWNRKTREVPTRIIFPFQFSEKQHLNISVSGRRLHVKDADQLAFSRKPIGIHREAGAHTARGLIMHHLREAET